MPITIPSGAVDNTTITEHMLDALHGGEYPAYDAVYDGVTAANSLLAILTYDGEDVDYLEFYPILRDRALPYSSMIPSSLVNTADHVTTANLLEMEAHGIEIGCHSASHGSVVWNYGTFGAETVTAIAALRALGVYCQSFSPPGNWHAYAEHAPPDSSPDFDFISAAKVDNTRANRIIRECALGWGSYVDLDYALHSGAHAWTGIPSARRNAVYLHSKETASLATLKAEIDALAYMRAFTIMAWHPQYLDTGGAYLSLADFTTLMNYIVTARDAGYIDVVTFSAGLMAKQAKTRLNLLNNAGFETNSTKYWKVANSPTVEGSGRTGAYCARVNATDTLHQEFVCGPLRSLYIEGYAKAQTSGQTPTAQIIVRDMETAAEIAKGTISCVNPAAWERIAFCCGVHPANHLIGVYIEQGGGVGDVLFDDLAVYKV